ncbi:MAG TPA: BON domain-containing protein [Planctomycetaceae bacterium]|jgi:osmotically-inducible protein OsmY
MRIAVLAISSCLALGCNEPPTPAPSRATQQNSAVETDNTGRNVRDRDNATKTPIDQNENKNDVELTATIRKRVIEAKLSTAAQNVKIITQDGKVTLRGPVDSTDEQARIEEIAVAAAGEGHVDNQLEVKEPK